ncbi:hypothetical protein E2C01_075290 [Portunus trituberculatus]|uniref:Uncharacterized protein n=1 Tax=Portunus trituberculatus TaxID=210409 RepID=A0A5B7IAC7_PORTR|nr:hypothetical protein [Portunus trituberculatus]
MTISGGVVTAILWWQEDDGEEVEEEEEEEKEEVEEMEENEEEEKKERGMDKDIWKITIGDHIVKERKQRGKVFGCLKKLFQGRYW